MIFVVSGPGGVGKGTIVRRLVATDPTLWLSRSWTSRPPRPDEDHSAYKFVSADEFRAHAQAGKFLEWVEFLGNYYGTPLPEPPPGTDLLLEIELKGAQHVRKLYPEAVLILVAAPSIEEQRQRLRRRGEADERIQERIDFGVREMVTGEKVADEILVNDDLETAVEALRSIIDKYRTANGGGATREGNNG